MVISSHRCSRLVNPIFTGKYCRWSPATPADSLYCESPFLFNLKNKQREMMLYRTAWGQSFIITNLILAFGGRILNISPWILGNFFDVLVITATSYRNVKKILFLKLLILISLDLIIMAVESIMITTDQKWRRVPDLGTKLLHWYHL